MVPVQITARCHTSRGALASTRLRGARAAPSARAAGLVRGGSRLGSPGTNLRSGARPVPSGAVRSLLSPAGKSSVKNYQLATEVVMVEAESDTCCCSFMIYFVLCLAWRQKNSCDKMHKGERLPSIEERLYYVPAKPVRNKKMAFCLPYIALSHIAAELLPEFKLKKSSKQW